MKQPVERHGSQFGGQPRVSTVLYMVPRSGIAVVLLCNLEGVSSPLLDLARGVTATLLR